MMAVTMLVSVDVCLVQATETKSGNDGTIEVLIHYIPTINAHNADVHDVPISFFYDHALYTLTFGTCLHGSYSTFIYNNTEYVACYECGAVFPGFLQ